MGLSDRNKIMNAIEVSNVDCSTKSCSEMYMEKAFDVGGMRPEKRLPVAEVLGEFEVRCDITYLMI